MVDVTPGNTPDEPLWYADNHPYEAGEGWSGCVDCGKPESDSIHDDPREGQDFDWKWGDR